MKIPDLPTYSDHPLQLLKDLSQQSESEWIQRGEKRALQLFHLMAAHVPAYKDFLKKQRVNPNSIKDIHDFKQLPTIDKQNYLRAYPREALCWGGELKQTRWTFSSTSGSTGEPYYFPRQSAQDVQYALTAELYLRTNFEIHKNSTLYIVCFPMGVWIGGLFTYEALRRVAQRGDYALSIITPGISKLEIIKAVKNIGHHFDQIIIGSYAPFLKDILDDGVRSGINWKDYKLGFVFSAEGFTEVFRDYVVETAGLTNPYLQTLNHYGTVDLGTMSHETPLAIMLRRMALQNSSLYKALFGQTQKLPTLTQYNPEHFFFEDRDGDLICSAFSGLPLVRYDLKDHGGILKFETVQEKSKDLGLNLEREAKRVGIDKTIWNLPFVYVYERSDFSVSFFAFQIYPEVIRKALQEKACSEQITGKFTMQVVYDTQAQQQLEIHVELKHNRKSSEKLIKIVKQQVIDHLLAESSEYRKTYEEYGSRIYPKIIFWPYEDPTYFRPGIKQKWVKK